MSNPNLKAMKNFTSKFLKANLYLLVPGKLACLFLIFLCFINEPFAQRMYPNMDVSVTSGSDYKLTFTYSNAGAANCDCTFDDSQTYKVLLHKNGTEQSNIVQTWSGNVSMTNGTYNYIVGPGVSAWWYLAYQSIGNFWCGNCLEWVWGDPVYGFTSSVKSPINISASDQAFYDKIEIKWAKGTDLPDENIEYRIYKGTSLSNAVLIQTVSGKTFEWTDNTIVPNDVFFYWVTTYSNTTSWGIHESQRNVGNAVTGKAKTVNVDASDGLYTARVKIQWEDLSEFVEEIRVERSIPNSTETEELAILSKNAQAYSDNEAIPGYNHIYFITPINSTREFPTLSDRGYIKPNGTIKGTVLSLLGAGVEGVQVCAKPITVDLPAGALPAPDNGYCATTDIDGYYEIRNIYYFDEAEFKIVAFKAGPIENHIFTPDAIKRVLDINSKLSSGANFTDQSVFTVGGKVTFPLSSTEVECGVQEVEILFNGENRGIFTDNNGQWFYAIQDEGTYTFQPKFKHHYFENAQGNISSTVMVNDDITNIDFMDLQVDSIKIKVQGGCGDPVANSVKIQITSPGNCYNRVFTTDENGLLTISDLPARKYNVQVVELNPVNTNIFDQLGYKPITIDLTVRDTAEVVSDHEILEITPADTVFLPNGKFSVTPADTVFSSVQDTIRQEVIPKADFIYHSPINITVDFEDAGAEVFTNCKNSDNKDIIVMDQNAKYKLIFDISEQLGNCPIKEGKLKIFDFVSDLGDTPIEIPVVNGFAFYEVKAGLPEIAESDEHKHEKLLFVLPEIGFLDAAPVAYWITVTGVKTQAPSFITQSPELPMLILHDPPGDNSYAYVEKGTKYKSFETHEILWGGGGGVFANLLIGAKVLTPFSSNSFGTLIRFSAVYGHDSFNRDGLETTITFNERFSTSDLENLTGNDGDVYIGASFNQVFAIGDELSFDPGTCEAKVKAVPTIDMNGFATTFIYTEKHILNTLIPKLGELRRDLIGGRSENELSEEEKLQANQLLYDSLHWRNVIAKNTANRDTTAIFKKNISFNAGAVYSSEFVSDTINSASYEYKNFVNADLALGIKIDNATGAWYDSELGITGNFRWSSTTNTGDDTTLTRKVGYMLNDNDIGDYFSVDIKEDIAYGVPSFYLKSGTTSCPHEPKSQPRDDARIQIFPPQINNVPIGGQAVFTANLLNESQSRETREYQVRVVSTTNPDGAIIKLGGEQINNKPSSFFLDFGQTASVALTVEKGPLATTYDSIGIMMFPPCEYSLWQDNGKITSGDTAWFFIDFQSDCSNASLYLPGDGWLVNQNNNDILDVAFTGYDLNNEYFESITLQYKREGQGWLDDVTFQKNELTGNFFDYTFDVSGLPDGNYRLRVKAWCGIEGGFSYSSEQKGIIDRTSLAPFGSPSPADGFLRDGQEISVVFDKDINCNFSSYDNQQSVPVVKIFTEDGTEIPSSVQCSENQDKIIIVPDQDLFTQPLLEGVKLNAVVEGIQDISGNVQKYKTEWSFLVNVSPVAWNPPELFIEAEQSQKVIINAILDNSAVFSKSFIISEWPEWLTPLVTSASILSGNNFTVPLKVAEELEPGFYEGEVVALIDDMPEILMVNLILFAKDVSWSVNPSDFEYNMNITAQYSYDNEDINLSTQVRDKIAAYINGELRGVGNIEFVPELNKYVAFINVYSNLPGDNGSLIESEDYVDDLSVQDISVIDNGVSSGATRFKKSNWIDFNIYATKTQNFTVELRVASVKSGNAELWIDGVLKTSFMVPNTSSLTSFSTTNTTLNISEGPHKLRIVSKDTEFDLNWINFPEYHVRNQHSAEVVKFRIWDGLKGIEYGAVEELTFFNDGVIGNAQKPFILHPAGGLQEINLAKGWTWISINKESNSMDVDKVFESITSPNSLNDITLKSQTSFSQYTLNTGWQGNLKYVDILEGYMIYLSNHADKLSLIGKSPDNNIKIPLNPKWNWIGYPKAVFLDANEVLKQLNSTPGDIIKNQFEFAEYNGNTNSWLGDMKFFQPGRGYKLFVSNADEIEILKSGDTDELYLKHEYNMTLTATVDFGQLPVSENYLLRTYIAGQLRGVIPLNYVDKLGKYMAFAMVYGDRADIGEDVNLTLYDHDNNSEIKLSSANISFGIDKIEGTLNNPVVLSVLKVGVDKEYDNSLKFITYPNPFSGQTKISYNIPNDSHVVLSISDAFGKEIVRIVDSRQISGQYEYIFEAGNLASGIYYCILRTNDTIETIKLIRY